VSLVILDALLWLIDGISFLASAVRSLLRGESPDRAALKARLERRRQARRAARIRDVP
jgi:hypothetical protein